MATTTSVAVYHRIATCDETDHQAPSVPFTVDQAHDVMRYHVACRARRCPRKAAARDTLVLAGRMVLSTTKPR